MPRLQYVNPTRQKVDVSEAGLFRDTRDHTRIEGSGGLDVVAKDLNVSPQVAARPNLDQARDMERLGEALGSINEGFSSYVRASVHMSRVDMENGAEDARAGKPAQDTDTHYMKGWEAQSGALAAIAYQKALREQAPTWLNEDVVSFDKKRDELRNSFAKGKSDDFLGQFNPQADEIDAGQGAAYRDQVRSRMASELIEKNSADAFNALDTSIAKIVGFDPSRALTDPQSLIQFRDTLALKGEEVQKAVLSTYTTALNNYAALGGNELGVDPKKARDALVKQVIAFQSLYGLPGLSKALPPEVQVEYANDLAAAEDSAIDRRFSLDARSITIGDHLLKQKSKAAVMGAVSQIEAARLKVRHAYATNDPAQIGAAEQELSLKQEAAILATKDMLPDDAEVALKHARSPVSEQNERLVVMGQQAALKLYAQGEMEDANRLVDGLPVSDEFPLAAREAFKETGSAIAGGANEYGTPLVRQVLKDSQERAVYDLPAILAKVSPDMPDADQRAAVKQGQAEVAGRIKEAIYRAKQEGKDLNEADLRKVSDDYFKEFATRAQLTNIKAESEDVESTLQVTGEKDPKTPNRLAQLRWLTQNAKTITAKPFDQLPQSTQENVAKVAVALLDGPEYQGKDGVKSLISHLGVDVKDPAALHKLVKTTAEATLTEMLRDPTAQEKVKGVGVEDLVPEMILDQTTGKMVENPEFKTTLESYGLEDTDETRRMLQPLRGVAADKLYAAAEAVHLVDGRPMLSIPKLSPSGQQRMEQLAQEAAKEYSETGLSWVKNLGQQMSVADQKKAVLRQTKIDHLIEMTAYANHMTSGEAGAADALMEGVIGTSWDYLLGSSPATRGRQEANIDTSKGAAAVGLVGGGFGLIFTAMAAGGLMRSAPAGGALTTTELAGPFWQRALATGVQASLPLAGAQTLSNLMDNRVVTDSVVTDLFRNTALGAIAAPLLGLIGRGVGAAGGKLMSKFKSRPATPVAPKPPATSTPGAPAPGSVGAERGVIAEEVELSSTHNPWPQVRSQWEEANLYDDTLTTMFATPEGEAVVVAAREVTSVLTPYEVGTAWPTLAALRYDAGLLPRLVQHLGWSPAKAEQAITTTAKLEDAIAQGVKAHPDLFARLLPAGEVPAEAVNVLPGSGMRWYTNAEGQASNTLPMVVDAATQGKKAVMARVKRAVENTAVQPVVAKAKSTIKKAPAAQPPAPSPKAPKKAVSGPARGIAAGEVKETMKPSKNDKLANKLPKEQLAALEKAVAGPPGTSTEVEQAFLDRVANERMMAERAKFIGKLKTGHYVTFKRGKGLPRGQQFVYRVGDDVTVRGPGGKMIPVTPDNVDIDASL